MIPAPLPLWIPACAGMTVGAFRETPLRFCCCVAVNPLLFPLEHQGGGFGIPLAPLRERRGDFELGFAGLGRIEGLGGSCLGFLR